MPEQMNMFECLYPRFSTDKKIRLIELFAGYGSQALALKYLGVPFEHWKICEWNYKSIQAYKDIHFPYDDTDYSICLSKEQLANYLAITGISSNWNEPMKAEQIKRLNESKLREIYNNISATHNLVDVSKIHANDLQIINKDQYTYILTYSFPCQDLSLAGRREGMDRGSDTRSGLLWEVERILLECKEENCLPDVLLMENVPQVHGTENARNWREWLTQLERLGYQSYWEDMIATDYGIPQIRNRTFCVSLLGEHSYNFPTPIKLTKRLKDLLENKVDDKYYLSDTLLKNFIANEQKQAEKGNGFKFDVVDAETEGDRPAKSIATRVGADPTNTHIGHITSLRQAGTVYNPDETVGTLLSRDCKSPKMVGEVSVDNEYYEIKQPHGYFPDSVKKADAISTIDACVNYQHIVLGEKLKINNATKQGYLEAEEGDGIDITTRPKNHRGTVQKGAVQTLSTMPDKGVVVKEAKVVDLGSYKKSQYSCSGRVVSKDYVAPTFMENHGDVIAVVESRIERHYKNFYEKNGYIPEVFDAHNEVEIGDNCKTIGTTNGPDRRSGGVLIAEKND